MLHSVSRSNILTHRTLVPWGKVTHLHEVGIGMFGGVALEGTTFTLDAIHDP